MGKYIPTGVRTSMQPDCVKRPVQATFVVITSIKLFKFTLFLYVLYVVVPQHKLGKWYFPSRNYQFPSPMERSISS